MWDFTDKIYTKTFITDYVPIMYSQEFRNFSQENDFQINESSSKIICTPLHPHLDRFFPKLRKCLLIGFWNMQIIFLIAKKNYSFDFKLVPKVIVVQVFFSYKIHVAFLNLTVLVNKREIYIICYIMEFLFIIIIIIDGNL